MQTVAVVARSKRAVFPGTSIGRAATKDVGGKGSSALQPLAPPTPAKQAVTPVGALLTEQALLAMPDKDYMNGLQLAFFRVKLEQLRTELMDSASRTTADMRDADGFTPDPMDRATLEEEHALELIARERDRKTLQQVAQSLARIASGDYGWCEETGEPIGLARLLARPTASMCIAAQTRSEQRQRMYC